MGNPQIWLPRYSLAIGPDNNKKEACFWSLVYVCRLDDFDGEEVDEEALIEQRRQQRMAIVQVCINCWSKLTVLRVTTTI